MPDSKKSQASIRFVMLGGFLGSGKTTALLRVAREHTEAGKRGRVAQGVSPWGDD